MFEIRLATFHSNGFLRFTYFYMKKVLMVVVVVTTLISCKKEKVNPKLKNVLFTSEITRFKDGTTWVVVNNPRVNNNK